jgi:hypothetical protein
MYVEHIGIMTVKNITRSEICMIEFKKRGWTGKGANELEGYVFNSNYPNNKRATIRGRWTDELYA